MMRFLVEITAISLSAGAAAKEPLILAWPPAFFALTGLFLVAAVVYDVGSARGVHHWHALAKAVLG